MDTDGKDVMLRPNLCLDHAAQIFVNGVSRAAHPELTAIGYNVTDQ